MARSSGLARIYRVCALTLVMEIVTGGVRGGHMKAKSDQRGQRIERTRCVTASDHESESAQLTIGCNSHLIREINANSGCIQSYQPVSKCQTEGSSAYNSEPTP